MAGENKVAFKLIGRLSREDYLIIFTNISVDKVRNGQILNLKKENIVNGDKKQKRMLEKMLFEVKVLAFF